MMAAVLSLVMMLCVLPFGVDTGLLTAEAADGVTLSVKTAPGATVQVDDQTVTADNSGAASLTLTAGDKVVHIRCAGCEPSAIPVTLTEDSTLTCTLHSANSLTASGITTVEQASGGYYSDANQTSAAFDGDYTTGWQAKEMVSGDYVGALFDATETVSSAAIWWESGSRPTASRTGYALEYTTDGTNWTAVPGATYTYGTESLDTCLDTVTFDPVSAAGIRVVVYSFTSTKYAAKVWELHAYADAAAGGYWTFAPDYAGTVDTARVGDVYAQYNADETVIRLIAAVDSLNYVKAGFTVTVEGQERKEYFDNVVYSKVGDVTPASLGMTGGYLVVLVITDLPEEFVLTARAFVTTSTGLRYSSEEGTAKRLTDKATFVQNPDPWTVEPGVNYGDYNFVGRGEELIKEIGNNYSGYTVNYYKDGAALSQGDLNNMVNVMASYTADSTTNTVTVNVTTIAIRVWCEYASVTASAGTFLTINFTSNLPSPFVVSIGQQGSLWGEINQSGVVPSGSNGTYSATVKMSVPYLDPGQYAINFSIDSWNGGYPFVTSVPLTITESTHADSEYYLLFAGDWDLVTAEGYMDRIEELFYTSYSRIYARFGNGSEPRTITFSADKNYDGVAYAAGNGVTVSVDFANANPYSIGFFSHEITHSVQQYGNVEYGGDAWWVENMANYGGFRYFHWANKEYVQVYEATDGSLQDWGWQAYGNNKWFFAYMDSRYPTTRNADGTLSYGLIDSINRMIKQNPSTYYEDDPYDTTNAFNQMVYTVTGYACMEDLRLRFVEELKAGTWNFTGFGDYVDNFLTEDLPGIPNPDYPAVTEKNPGKARGTILDSLVSDSSNLLSGAKVVDASGVMNSNENGDKLIDGNKSTKWCSSTSTVERGEFCLDGAQQWIMIDLGELKDFNTYTVFNTGYSEWGYGNMNEWELLVSPNKEDWTSVDYQADCRENSVSIQIGPTTARYLLLKIYNVDSDGDGTLRLYELELYNK